MVKYIVAIVLLCSLAMSYQNGDVIGEIIKFSAVGVCSYYLIKRMPT